MKCTQKGSGGKMQKAWKNEDVGIVLRDNTQKTIEIKIQFRDWADILYNIHT